MGIFDILKPKWRQSDINVRLEAVSEFGESDRETLLEIASTDPEDSVRIAAIDKINAQADLEQLLNSQSGTEAKEKINSKLDEIYKKSVLAGKIDAQL